MALKCILIFFYSFPRGLILETTLISAGKLRSFGRYTHFKFDQIYMKKLLIYLYLQIDLVYMIVYYIINLGGRAI